MSLPTNQPGRDFPGDDGDRLATSLQRLAAGDKAARQQLIAVACRRMEAMAHRMLRKFPNVKRWVQTADVVQDASMRLWKTLEKLAPEDEQQFFGLCAVHVHRQLLDLSRKFGGPQSFASKHQTNHRRGGDGQRSLVDAIGVLDTWKEELEIWRVILETLAKQPPRAAQAFRLVHFLGATRRQAAEQLGVDRKTVDRDLALVQDAIDKAVKGVG